MEGVNFWNFSLFNSWNLFFFSFTTYWNVLVCSFTRIILKCFSRRIFLQGIYPIEIRTRIWSKKALIYQGVIFTLVHIPAKTIQFSIDGNLILYLGSFCLVFLYGIIYGLIYMKTRNLWASVICHYLTNWAVATILLFI